MRKFYRLSTLWVLSILLAHAAHAQDFSNKGKDFWVAYGYHQIMTAGNAQDMVLYFAAEQNTNVTVTIPGLGWSQNYFVPANSAIASNQMPKGSPDARLLSESSAPEDKGIHITADHPIIAYAHIYNQSVSGASILYPTTTLGKEYYSINYTNISNTGSSNCWFYVIATDTGSTTVEITPSAATINHAAGVTFTVTLTQGQVYNVMGQYSGSSGVDLTGSHIQSINTGSGCKKIAVYSGSGRIAISCNGATPSSDNYMTQAMPKAAWGKKYLTTPIVAYNVNNGGTFSASTVTFYRICVADPTTVVKINGSVTGLPLQGGFYYQVTANSTPMLIEGDKPIAVAQYFPSQSNPGPTGCGTPNGDGDPEVIYLSPVEQSIAKVIWNANSRYMINVNKHYINVVIPNTGTAISSFKLDGVTVPSSSFTVHPQDAGFSYARINVNSLPGPGNVGKTHVIESDSGFNAIAYGYGGAESYGYNAGTNIKDLFQFINIKNTHGTVNFPATCKNTPFRLSMVFPYRPVQIDWIFGAALNAMGFNDTTIYNGGAPLVEDSSWVVAGRTLYRYRLPRTYAIIATGTYPIRVIATNPTPDNCGNTQEIDFDLEVFEPPIADFTFTTTGCFNSPVSFFDNSNTGGRPVTERYWDFGDLLNSNLNNPTHTYAAPGTYNVKYTVVTDVGCLADTMMHPVTLDPPPTAAFTASTPACEGGTINFTDNSVSNGSGTINTWAWDFGDPSSGPNNTSNLQNPTHTFAAPGVYTVTLQVQTASGCQSTVYSFQVSIHPKPIPDFALPGVCLPTGFAQFNDLSTIAAGESITGWDWDFGDGSPHSNLQNPTHNYAGTGPYNVTLTTTSSNGCVASITKTLTTIYAEPQAAFTVTPDVCLGNTSSFTD